MIVGKLYCLLSRRWESILAPCLPSPPTADPTQQQCPPARSIHGNPLAHRAQSEPRAGAAAFTATAPPRALDSTRAARALGQSGYGWRGDRGAHTTRVRTSSGHSGLHKNEHFGAEVTVKRKPSHFRKRWIKPSKAAAAECHRNTTALQLLRTETEISIIAIYWKTDGRLPSALRLSPHYLKYCFYPFLTASREKNDFAKKSTLNVPSRPSSWPTRRHSSTPAELLFLPTAPRPNMGLHGDIAPVPRVTTQRFTGTRNKLVTQNTRSLLVL